MGQKTAFSKARGGGKNTTRKFSGGPPVWVALWLPMSALAQEASVGQRAFHPSDYLGQVALSLLLVIGLIFAAAWVLKRFSQWPGQKGQAIRILSAIAVGRQEKLLLVQVGGSQLLIGVTPARISVLHELAEPVQLADNADHVPSSAFAQRLQDAIRSYSQRDRSD